ncbi:PRC-barrel domain-containing protein [Sphingomonas floccifaciens]|uniref:PRC-barrel domain-containing protein n=1 Tax=Sphingomonas floccifaciens TaxID=1844115 RepID=A0ABW4NJU8_9SPHN
MTRTLFTTAALALAIAATPASAQLLGGGGGVGGMLGGGLGSGLGGTLRGPGPMIDGTLRRSGAGEVRTERQVDRRSGRVRAGGTASGQGGTLLDGGLPIGSGSAETRGSGSAGGSADAQLIGTDAVRSTARSAVGEARGLAGRGREAIGGARDTVGGARDAVGSAAGSAAGSATGAASGSGSLTNGMLALAGSAAADGAGSFDVAPGMNVVDAKGRALGTVRSLKSEANGRVREVLVQVGDRVATLPAANFSGEGNVLVSAMGRGAVKREASEQ